MSKVETYIKLPEDLAEAWFSVDNIPKRYIVWGYAVIAKPALVAFWMKHPAAERPLQAWHHTMESEVFADFNDLRETFPSADYVDGLTVFNIGGNKYRLIAAIHYNRRKVYIRCVLTHAEYDRGDWKRRT
jgi:mRNA interferase HigB